MKRLFSGLMPAILVAAFVLVFTGDTSVWAQMQVSGSKVWSIITDGTLTASLRDTGASDSLNVAIVDASGNQVTSFGGGTQYTHDAALTVGTTVGTMAMGRASAAVPTDVSADGDAVLPWFLRSGAQAVQPTLGGVLASTGNGVDGTGVQRVTLASNGTGVVGLNTGSNVIGALTANQSVNVTQFSGTAAVSGSGNATGALRVELANNGTGLVGLNAGTALIGKVAPNTTCGTTAFDLVWAAVPTSATAGTGTTTCNLVVIVTNTNATAQTIVITDGQGSPVTIVPTFSIPGNSMVRFELGKVTTGFKWTAGGAGLTGAALGIQ